MAKGALPNISFDDDIISGLFLDSARHACVESMIELALPINQWGEVTNDIAD